MGKTKMKLKTLKDFKLRKEDGTIRINSRNLTLDEIKAEAIKWVKNERSYHNKYRDARADVLMELHDITEEDLKSKNKQKTR